MESALRFLRTLRMVMLGSVLLSVLLAARFGPAPRNTSPVVLYAIVLMAVWIMAGIFAVRRLMVMRADNILGTNPEDPKALARWQAGYIIVLGLSEAIALHGLVLRFLGFGFSQALPLLLASFVLMLFFGPRRPSNGIG